MPLGWAHLLSSQDREESTLVPTESALSTEVRRKEEMWGASARPQQVCSSGHRYPSRLGPPPCCPQAPVEDFGGGEPAGIIQQLHPTLERRAL